MQTFREAADAMVSAKKKHPGLAMKITVETYGACIHGIMGDRSMDHSVSWLDMSDAHVNVLAICVGDVARNLASLQPAT